MKQRVLYYGNAIDWYFNGKMHRDRNLPASYYFTYREIEIIYFQQHGKYHRTTGPAYIDYDYKKKRYYYQDRRYDSLEELLMMEACR